MEFENEIIESGVDESFCDNLAVVFIAWLGRVTLGVTERLQRSNADGVEKTPPVMSDNIE